MNHARVLKAPLPDTSGLMSLIGVLEARHQTDRTMIEAFAQAIGKRLEKLDTAVAQVNASLARNASPAASNRCGCGHERLWHLPVLTEESGPGSCGFCLSGCPEFTPAVARV